MIKKIPKAEVNKTLPKKHLEKIKLRKKGYVPKAYYHEVEKMPLGLEFSPLYWTKLGKHNYFTLDVVPLIYRYFEVNQDLSDKELIFSDGYALTHAYMDLENCSVCIDDVRGYQCRKSVAKQKGYIPLFPSHTFKLTKDKHLLKRWIERGFDLSLLVPLYEFLIRCRAGDRVSVSDGNCKVMGIKVNGLTILAQTGIVLGEIDWDEFLDVKF
jgi:hypothetical protein